MIDSERGNKARFIFLVDLIRVFKKYRRKLIQVFLICAAIGFLYKAASKPEYKIEASFFEKEGNNSRASLSSLMGNLVSSGQEKNAVIMMSSYRLLEKLTQDLGLNVSIHQKKNLFQCIFNRIYEALCLEFKYRLPDQATFEIRDVIFPYKEVESYSLIFTDTKSFRIVDHKGKTLTSGSVGSPVAFSDIQFTLLRGPENIDKDSAYTISFQPIQSTVKLYKEKICFYPHKENPSIVLLELYDSNKERGILTLNHLMNIYRDFLKEESFVFAEHQLNYLLKRQNEITDKMDETLAEYELFLEKGAKDLGVMGFESEKETMSEPLIAAMSDLDSINLELDWLNQYTNPGFDCDINPDLSKGFEIAELRKQSEALKRERDDFDLALNLSIQRDSSEKHQQVLKNNILNEWTERLKTVRSDKEAALQLLDKFEDPNFKAEFEDIFSKDSFFASFTDKMDSNAPVEDMKTLVKKVVHSLSLQEQHLTNQDWRLSTIPDEVRGMGVEVAKSLHLQYNSQLDNLHLKSQQYQYLLEQINDPQFELTSLSTILQDQVSQGMIASVSDISLKLKDQSNQTQKEILRLQEELRLQKRFLHHHLQEMLRLNQLNASVIKNKIRHVQQLALEGINQKLSATTQQISDQRQIYLDKLQQRKKILTQRIGELKEKLLQVPKQWRTEELLKVRQDLSTQVMQSITQLVEKKTIEKHISQVNSKVLDPPLASFFPEPKKLFLYTILFGLLGSFGVYALLTLWELLAGTSVSIPLLQSVKVHLSGVVSFSLDGPNVDYISDEDLETLRSIQSFSHEAHITTLALGQGPNYAHSLAELWVKRGHKVLVIETSFQATMNKKNQSGLLQAIESFKEFYPTKLNSSYDYLPPGGTTRFGTEIIASKSFFNFLEKVKKQYDKIIICTRTHLQFSEAKNYFSFSDKIVITLYDEKVKDLEPYFAYEDQCQVPILSYVIVDR